jgi:sterol desaturase/sphingolipid hydroxylase (fatty acid hydroxylase superfamily)
MALPACHASFLHPRLARVMELVMLGLVVMVAAHVTLAGVALYAMWSALEAGARHAPITATVAVVELSVFARVDLLV